MKTKLFFKKTLNQISSLLPYCSEYYSGVATIFTLHRVCKRESEKLYYNENMKVSPEFLEKFIVYLISNSYEFITLDALYELLQDGKKTNKNIVFTLDDGYKDNYEVAYPIFKKYNIPFTIYITTSFPEKTSTLWWFYIEDLLLKNDEIILGNGKRFICSTKSEKEKAFLEIRKIILNLEQRNIKIEIEKLLNEYKNDFHFLDEKLVMGWQEIVELSKETLCTIGGHTRNHYALNRLEKHEVVEEILDSNSLLESKIGKKIEHFAYPYGSKNEVMQREFDIVKKMGFKTATTTRHGNIYYEHKQHLESLPRVMLTENFDFKTVGRMRFNKVVTI